MKNIWLISTGISLLSLCACTWNGKEKISALDSSAIQSQNSPEIEDSTHNSENSLDWNGKYTGVIPCADCPGIETTIVLNIAGTFSYSGEYLERDVKVEDTGKFMWHNNGSVVHLLGKDINMKFKVGENQLIFLDQEGNPIEGPLKDNYILKKVI